MPAQANRIALGYKIRDHWHPRWGYRQVLFHEPSGAWWDLGRTFELESHVKILNAQIAADRFDPLLQIGLSPCRLERW